MKRFSIIIVNWNGKHLLKTCFDSIEAQSFKDYEVIFVDNGSHDGSVAFVKANYPNFHVISLNENTGFAKANNIGIKAAQGELIALVNNDTELDNNWLQAFDQAALSSKAAFFASKMLDFKNRQIIDACGDALTWSGRSYKMGELKKDGEDFSEQRYVFGACGGAAVYRKTMLEKIGLFDEQFFAYLEDVDIDFRAQLAGFRCLLVPEARIYHIGSATAGKRSGYAFSLMIKNHFHLIYKNFPWQKILLNAPKITYSEIRFFAAAVRYHFVRQYFSALWRALLEHPKMIKKRYQIQQSRKVDFKYLDSIIEKKFAYKPLFK